MAEKRRFLDVWIVETNTVYQEVPFDVVADWLQQGRLLDDDRVKPSGTRDWIRIGDSSEFRPYSLAPAAHQPPEDTAAALEAEPSHVSEHPRRHAEGEDEDVDMIPLIDVSLVLLIFFMLTASAVGASAFVDTPRTDHGALIDDPKGLRVDITPDDDGTPLYTVAEGDKPGDEDDKELRSLQALLERLRAHLSRREGPTELTINAHKELKAKVARDLLLALRAEPFRSKVSSNFFGVSEKEP